MPRINYLILCVLFTFSHVCQALPTDRDQPLTAKSDMAKMVQTTYTGIYTKNVVIVQGSTIITTDNTVTVVLDEHNQLDHATALGAVGKPAIYKTVPHLGDQPVTAMANRMEYYPKKNLLRLSGNASITQQHEAGSAKDSYTAELINYNIETKTVETPKLPGQQAVIVIQPKPKSKPS